MKILTSLQGSVAIKYSYDEAAPEIAIRTRDIIEYIGRVYQFSSTPEVPPGLFVNNFPFVFQTGVCPIDDQPYVINQLTFVQGALVLTAKDTDLADKLFVRIVEAVDQQFGLHIDQAIRTRYYQSNLSAELSSKIVAQLHSIQTVVNQFITRGDNRPLDLKRLAFGAGDVANIFAQQSIDDIPNADFVLERRPGEPYELNRFFSSAPLPTDAHRQMLDAIEALFI